MTKLIFADLAAHERIAEDLFSTPAISGGTGPVRIGLPASQADGRQVVAHPFTELEEDWLSAYVADSEFVIESD